MTDPQVPRSDRSPILMAPEARPLGRKRRWPFVALISIIAISVAAIWQANVDRPFEVSVEKVTTKNLEGSFTAEAYVRGREYQLASETSGRVVSLQVREGDRVKSGQVLMSVDSEDARQALFETQALRRSAEIESARASASLRASELDLVARLRSASADLAQAEANLRRVRAGSRPEEIGQAQKRLEKTNVGLDDAKRGLDRATFLFDQGAIPKASLEAAEARFASANADVGEAQAFLTLLKAGARSEDVSIAMKGVDSAKAVLAVVQSGAGQIEPLRLQVAGANSAVNRARSAEQRAQQAVRRVDLRAPVAGAVTRITIEPGTVAMAGVPVITLSTREDLRIEAEIGSEDSGKIQEGMPVMVTSAAYPGRTFSARLIQAMPVGELKPDAAIRTRIVRAKIALDSGWSMFRPGMEVDVEGKRVLRRALCLPSDAITITGEGTAVYVVVDGIARTRTVQTGLATSSQTEVLSGLVPGDMVVVRGQEGLVDGAKVKVRR
jgi:HlyD family secretion protein